MAERYYNVSDQDSMFKSMYGSGKRSVVNKKAPLSSILLKNKTATWVGSDFVEPIRMGNAAGFGYRATGQNLPSPMAAVRKKVTFTAKKAYATAEFDREAIVASRSDAGSFARATLDEVESVEEGFVLHMLERPLFGDSTGKLGEVSATAITGAGTDADPWVVTPKSTSTNAPAYKKQYYAVNAKVDFYSAAGVFQLSAKVKSRGATTVSFVLYTNGSALIPANGDFMYWEGDRNQEVTGLAQICPKTPGTLYGISQSDYPDFQGPVSDVAGAALTYETINTAISEANENTGEDGDVIIGSSQALSLLKSQAEDQKRYNVGSTAASGNAQIGFKGLEIITDSGSANMIASQMCPKDEIYILNTKYLQLVMRQDFGWFDDDGTILMRDANKDLYNSRYGGYFELYCSKPSAQYRITGFSVT